MMVSAIEATMLNRHPDVRNRTAIVVTPTRPMRESAIQQFACRRLGRFTLHGSDGR